MSVYLQGEIWWYEFYIGRKRYRSSTLSNDKTIAQKIEAEHRESKVDPETKPGTREVRPFGKAGWCEHPACSELVVRRSSTMCGGKNSAARP